MTGPFYTTCRKQYHDMNGGEIHYSGVAVNTGVEHTAIIPVAKFFPRNEDLGKPSGISRATRVFLLKGLVIDE